MNRTKSKKTPLLLLLLLLACTLPIKLGAWFFILASIITITIKSSLNKTKALALSTLLASSLATSLILNGASAVAPFLLSLFFMAPIILCALIKNPRHIEITRADAKWVIEKFLIIQVAISATNIIYFLFFVRSGGLDVNFGDVVAGTLRIPFIYSEDSSNKVFAFLMLITIFFYTCLFDRKEISVPIVTLSALTIFLASVNHLTIIFIAALLASSGMNFKRIVAAAALSLTAATLYSALQPTNAMIIQERAGLLISALSEGDSMGIDKIEYWFSSLKIIKENIIPSLTFGIGPGTYSSRAAHFMGGTLQANFPFFYESAIFKEFSRPAFSAYIAKAQYLKGSFYYPYDGIISLAIEYGAIFTTLLFIWLRSNFYTLGKKAASFLVIFISLTSLVDHYPEYIRATSCLLILIVIAKGMKKQSILRVEPSERNTF